MAAVLIFVTLAQAQISKVAIKIDQQVDAALKKLYKSSPAARRLQKNATAILVFPTVVKAGFGFGGATGYGSLRQNGKTTGYYDTFSASSGFQAGLQGDKISRFYP